MAAATPTLMLPTATPALDWAAQSAASTRVIRQLVAASLLKKKPTDDQEHEAQSDLVSDANAAADKVAVSPSTVTLPAALKPGTIRLTSFPPAKLETAEHATIYPDLPCLVSWSINEWAYKKPGLPTAARGLFTRQISGTPSDFKALPRNNETAEYEVVIRGYDKFFNMGEVPATSLPHLQAHSRGPYYATVKENGCIIYIAAADPERVYVASKHSLTSPHAVKGAEWLDTHLRKVGKDRKDFARFLWDNKCTAVFELADDQFEEHVLAYPPELSGLWLHGLNYNTIEFRPVEMQACEDVAKAFGFHMVGSIKFDSFDDMLNHARTHVRIPGHLPSDPPRDIEGWVLRYTKPDGHTGMTKYKYQQPYLLYREWRELTRTLLAKGQGNMTLQPRHFLSHGYLAWVKRAVVERPELFADFKNQRGIIAVREAYLRETGVQISTAAANGKGRTVIVPVACVGVGKTTVGAMLHALFPNLVAHVQNDNIANKRPAADGRRPFDLQVVNALASRPIVFADRNNHMRELRDGLVEAVRETYPDATIVFAVWPLPEKGGVRDQVYDEVVKRIKARGENHQSLTPGRTPNLEAVVRMFVYKREEVDEREVKHAMEDVEGQVKVEAAANNDKEVVRAAYVPLDVFATPAENLKRLVDGLAKAGVKEAQTWVGEVAGKLASGDLTQLADEVSGRPVQAKVSRNNGKTAAGRKVKYYGLAIEEKVEAVAARAGVQVADPLVPKDELHVTIVHDADVKSAAQKAAEELAAADGFEKVEKKGKGKNKNTMDKRKQQVNVPATPAQVAWDACEDALGRHDDKVEVEIVLDEYRSSARVSAFKVKEMRPVMGVEWDVPILPVRMPHVTAGVAEGAKPVEANGLFDARVPEGVTVVDLSENPVVVKAILRGFAF